VFVPGADLKTISPSAIYDVADTVIAQRILAGSRRRRSHVSGARPARGSGLRSTTVALSNAGSPTDDVRLAIINCQHRWARWASSTAAARAKPVGQPADAHGRRYSAIFWSKARTAASSGSRTLRRRGFRPQQRSIAWFNKQPAVLIQITKQGDANVIDTVDRVKALIPE